MQVVLLVEPQEASGSSTLTPSKTLSTEVRFTIEK
jgi:hypothetical protein